MGRPPMKASDRKKPVSVALSPEIHRKLVQAAKDQGRSTSNLAEMILTEALSINNKIIKKIVDDKKRNT
jgi:hypothetical protein